MTTENQTTELLGRLVSKINETGYVIGIETLGSSTSKFIADCLNKLPELRDVLKTLKEGSDAEKQNFLQVIDKIKHNNLGDAAHLIKSLGYNESAVSLFIGSGWHGEVARIAEEMGNRPVAVVFYQMQGWYGDAGRIMHSMADSEKDLDKKVRNLKGALDFYQTAGWHGEALLVAESLGANALDVVSKLDSNSVKGFNDPRSQAMADAVTRLKEQSYGDAGKALQSIGLNRLASQAYVKTGWYGDAGRIAEAEGRLDDALSLFQQQGWYGDAGRVAERQGDHRLAHKLYKQAGWNSEAKETLGRVGGLYAMKERLACGVQRAGKNSILRFKHD